MNKTLLLSAFALLACTNDYDLFKPGGGVGGSGTGAGTTSNMGGSTTSNMGGSTTSNMGGSTTSNMGGTSSNGGAPTTTTTTTTTTTNTTATTTTGTGGMGGGPVTVPCGNGGECDVSAGESCCVAKTGSTNGTCSGMCNNGNQADLQCNTPSDCPGQECCINTVGTNVDGELFGAFCVDVGACDADPFFGFVACDPANDQCDGNTTCQDWDGTNLPNGFSYCKAP